MSQIQLNEKLKQILILLQNTFSCDDNEKRKKSEIILNKYSQNIVSFIQEIIICLTIDSKIINDQLKKSISMYIKNLIYNKYEMLNKNEEITLILLILLLLKINYIFYNENDNNNNNLISKIFLFLLQQIINPKENCLSYQSSNAIIFMLNNIEKNEILNSLINENLSKLILLINNDKNDNCIFFELLEEISEYNQINELIILPFISEITKKIEKDINNSSNFKNSNYQIIFGKCFNIIINILKKNKINEDKINEFENIIENIFSYIKEPEKIDFDDYFY